MRIYSKTKAAAAAEDVVKVAVADEDTPAEPRGPIELDLDDENDSDDDAYAAFEDIKNIKVIEVEDEGDSVLD